MPPRTRREAADAVFSAFQRDPGLAHDVLHRFQSIPVVGGWVLVGDRWVRVPLRTLTTADKPAGWYVTVDKKAFGSSFGHLVGRLGDLCPFAVVDDLEEGARIVRQSIESALPGVLIADADLAPGARVPAPEEPARPVGEEAARLGAAPAPPPGLPAPPIHETAYDRAPAFTHPIPRR